MASCTNPIYINTANVDYFGFASIFNPYLKTLTFDISGQTEFKAGGAANISQINFVVTDPQENTYNATIDPSDAETEVTITGLVAGLIYFGTYHIKGTLVEADVSTYDIEFDIEICDSNLLTSGNYIKGCVEMQANCLTAKLVITDENTYHYNKLTADTVSYDAKLWLPNDPDGSLELFKFNDLAYEKNLSGYFTGNYQLSVTAVATYNLDCNTFLEITYKGNLTKTIDCTADICQLNCCWAESVAIANGAGQKAGQMQEKLQEAEPYYLQAMGNYICGANASFPISKVNEILGCACTCRSFVITPAPITLGNKNVTGECGTTVTLDDNGDIKIHSFIYTFVKGDPTDVGYTLTTTQINECTKRTTIVFNYDVFQNNILIAIANNQQYITNWQDVLGIKDCPCDDVSMSNSPELLSVVGNPEFYKLEDTYFTKNDVVTGVEYEDNSLISGGNLQYTKYYDQVIQQQAVVNTFGQPFTIPCSVCGESITDLEGYSLISTMHSTCSCEELTECELSTPQVPYSERYRNIYRFNPQIEEPPTTTYTEIIDGDSYTMTKMFVGEDDESKDYSLVRTLIFRTDNTGDTVLHETRSIIGANVGAYLPTTNNTWGNFVSINHPTAINLDMSEIVNGEPVLYFVTFSGYICRAVRERSSECDERANWKVYVLGDTGHALYGMKKWIVDANGNRSFIFLNAITSKLYSFTYDGVGGKNIAANWTITDIGIDCAGSGQNFNVELEKNYIFTLEFGKIKLVIYTGGTSLANIQNPANYNEYILINNVAPSAVGFTNGVGGVAGATIWQAGWLQKIDVLGEERYYFSNFDADVANNYIKLSYLRYFTLEGADPTDGTDWTFYTEIIPSNNSILADGTWGISTTNTNGASQGMTYIDDLGWISGFIYGYKVFDFVNKENTIVTGQAVANGNIVIDNMMDTQFEYLLDNCVGGSGES